MNRKQCTDVNPDFDDDFDNDYEDDSDNCTLEEDKSKEASEQGGVAIKCQLAPLTIKEIEPEKLKSLVSDDIHYATGLRALVLRTLLKTQAAYRLTERSGQTVSRVTDFLGFDNYERYIANRTLSEVRTELTHILAQWEQHTAALGWMPPNLQKNLDELASVVDLDAVEKSVLGFAILAHAEPVLERAVGLMGCIAGFSVHRPVADILGYQEQSVQEALSRDGKLFQSGLLTIELRERGDIVELFDLLTTTFHSRMVMSQSDIRNLVSGFVRPATEAKLSVNQFPHVKDITSMTREYLQQSLLTKKAGANILIYGPPGTGKSQLARALAHELGVELLEISATNLAGSAVAPIRRIRSYSIAQSFFGDSTKVLLFDEVEEVFNLIGNDHSDNETAIPQKSFFNALLESNRIPTIWIANSVSRFDPAYLRRFDIALEMPIPPRTQRLSMLQDAFKGAVSNQLMDLIAEHEKITPALIDKIAKVTASFESVRTIEEREKRVVQLLNEKLRVQGSREISYKCHIAKARLSFDPDLVNCEEGLRQIVEGLKATRMGRLCLYGPPGTGKTAFGKWIAKELDLPHLVASGSSLRGMYVGETEKNIAKTFAMAKREGAVLQLDEADTFLADRSKDLRSHEVAHINEMLVQMENYHGVFIASTNLMDNIDDAALRRFDLSLRFDYLKEDAAVELLHRCAKAFELNVHDERLVARVRCLRGLTPGDFDQVIRRGQLTGIKDFSSLVLALEQANSLKKNLGGTKPIGFLKAA